MFLDYRPSKILITGRSGTGKTTLLCDILKAGVGDSLRWRSAYVYDWEGEIQKRVTPVHLVGRDLNAKRLGIHILDPTQWPFTGLDIQTGFQFSARAVLELAKCGFLAVPSVFVVDEIQTFGLRTFENEFRQLIQLGRRYALDVVCVCQQVNELDNRFRNQFTHIYTLQHADPYVLEQLSRWGFNPDQVRGLGRGRWLCLNTITGAILQG